MTRIILAMIARCLAAALARPLRRTLSEPQNIKFVVPFTAGSATDTLARLLGNRMSTTLGPDR